MGAKSTWRSRTKAAAFADAAALLVMDEFVFSHGSLNF